ncbi:MAG TPA: LTA synthase family protein [Arachidicoccus sp.]|nr:LTA synthase family protein [Arachidicoccus sp.]
MKQIKTYLRPFLALLYLYLILCTLLRIVLLFDPIVTGHISTMNIIKIFVLGALSNILIFFQVGALLWIYLLFLSNGKYKKPYGQIIFAILLLLFIYVTFFNTILNEYGSVLPLLGSIFLGIKTVMFGLMLFKPKGSGKHEDNTNLKDNTVNQGNETRKARFKGIGFKNGNDNETQNYRYKIRLGAYSFCIFVFVTCILLNTASEWTFFNEFGVRYNFIAVDYLIYTNEVIGNIMESYPVVPLFAGIGIVAFIITWLIVRKTKGYLKHLPSFKEKLVLIVINVAVILLGWVAIPGLSRLENAPNIFANELQADGVYKFYMAYTHNELNYFKFYPTLDSTKVFNQLQKEIPGIKGQMQNGRLNTERMISDSLPEVHKNVVLITVESLSADYMAHFGNKDNLTPFLDSLADQSLFFTNLYATGNRTVRGLEAVTLSLPPTPGESIIKRLDNKNKFGIGYLFKARDYRVKFLYGGYSYFDNMKDFYVGNGYEVVDRDNFAETEISFANVWGVCDEDMAKKAIQTMNTEARQGKLFFNHWMTVSNHRPFTYPNGKISIPGDAKSRKGGVMYTDYALQQFFKMAEKQPWFNNTIFIILADHCSSSAGRTELPMDKYRIPAIVYSKGFIQPEQVTTMASQMDLMPTILGLMHFSYRSKFFGQDIRKKSYQPRAFMATYQDMGYVKDSVLTILSPVKQVKQYQLKLKPQPGIQEQFQAKYQEIPMKTLNQKLVDEAITYYQSASWLLMHHGYQR